MKRTQGLAAALAVLMAGATAAYAGSGEITKAGKAHDFATVYGKALPPIGFVDFCGRNPQECVASKPAAARVALTPERWRLLHQVNLYVNAKIAPVSDQDLYGEPERWALPTDAGDCEDYVLLKRKYLIGLGFPAAALLITVVLDEKGEGHAVLTVAGLTGDFILDNRRDTLLRWSDAHYRFLKRQSSGDPLRWVALMKQPPSAGEVVAGGNRLNN